MSGNSLYVGNLAPEVTELALDEKFRTVGQVTSAKVCRDSVTHRSLLYGYVNFARPEDAKKALDDLNHEDLMGKPMRVSYVQRDPTQRKCVHCRVVVFWPLPSRPPCCLLTCARLGMANIHIKNLQKDINEKSLSELMSKFGSVVSLKVFLAAVCLLTGHFGGSPVSMGKCCPPTSLTSCRSAWMRRVRAVATALSTSPARPRLRTVRCPANCAF